MSDPEFREMSLREIVGLYSNDRTGKVHAVLAGLVTSCGIEAEPAIADETWSEAPVDAAVTCQRCFDVEVEVEAMKIGSAHLPLPPGRADWRRDTDDLLRSIRHWRKTGAP